MIDLDDTDRRKLVSWALSEAPLEACGLISAPLKGEGPLGLWSAENVAEEPEYSFLLSPREQIQILEAIWADDEVLVGIWHSHPNSGPEPSERDRQLAAALPKPLTWVIVGLYGGAQEPAVWVGELP